MGVFPALGNSLAVTASAPFTQAQGGDGSASKGCGNRSSHRGEAATGLLFGFPFQRVSKGQDWPRRPAALTVMY